MPRSGRRGSTVEVNGQAVTLVSATYHLPVTVAGVQIDCPVTKGHYKDCDPYEDSWGLDKDARLRLWPAGSPWTAPGTFAYPIRQRWFAGPTQMANEPSFVDGGDAPTGRPIYYHSGLDIGGCEGLVDVVSASDGLVVSAGGKALPEYPEIPFYKRADYDYVYVLDSQGWFYRYAHLKSIDPAIRPGERVKMGQKIGVLGKEGSSGGWSHLHFDIKARQPSGKWGIQEGYAFLWEAYRREHKPQVLAVARPHHLASVGEKVTLDGSRSWSAAGTVARFEWTFGDGSTADRAAGRAHVRPPRAVTARSSRSSIPRAGRLRLRGRAGHRQVAAGRAPAHDPRELRADAGHPPGRPGDVQGEDLPDHGRVRDVGLRRREPTRRGPVGWERQAVGPGRVRRGGAPLRQAGAVPRPRRADGPHGGEGGGAPPGAGGRGTGRGEHAPRDQTDRRRLGGSRLDERVGRTFEIVDESSPRRPSRSGAEQAVPRSAPAH